MSVLVGVISLICIFCLGALVLSSVIPPPIIVVVAIIVFIKYILVAGRWYYQSRRDAETRSDRDAVIKTQNADALVRALKILYKEPSNSIRTKIRRKYHDIFGYTHPSISEREENIEYLKTCLNIVSSMPIQSSFSIGFRLDQ